MISLLSIIYALSVHQALSKNLMQKVELKNYADQKSYVAKALFKVGLEALRGICLDIGTLVTFCMNLWAKATPFGARSS
jgi:hypothetical protein